MKNFGQATDFIDVANNIFITKILNLQTLNFK